MTVEQRSRSAYCVASVSKKEDSRSDSSSRRAGQARAALESCFERCVRTRVVTIDTSSLAGTYAKLPLQDRVSCTHGWAHQGKVAKYVPKHMEKYSNTDQRTAKGEERNDRDLRTEEEEHSPLVNEDASLAHQVEHFFEWHLVMVLLLPPCCVFPGARRIEHEFRVLLASLHCE